MQSIKANKFSQYYKPILRLGVPIAIGQIGVIVMGFADTMMVGNFNTQSLAAASFVNAVYNFIVYLMLGYSYGLTPLISALAGKKQSHEAGATLKYGLVCNMLFVALIMLCLGVAYFFLDHMGQPSEIMPLVKPYYLTLLVSLFFVGIFNTFRQFTDGVSDTSVGMWVILMGNVLNIVGNYLLIYGIGIFPRLGLLGAGISTMSARMVMAIVVVAIFLCRKRYELYREGFHRCKVAVENLKYIHAQSLPISLQMGMESGAFTVSGIMAGWLGAINLATYQVMITISGLGFLLYYSFGTGITIRVAHYVGQNDWARVRQSGYAGMFILLVMAALSSAIFLFAGEFIIRCFTSDVAVISLALTLIAPLIFYQLGDSMQICYANALRGTAHVKPVMWIAFISYVVINIPAAYIFAFTLKMGIMGIYYAFSCGLFAAAIMFAYQYYKVLRKKEKGDKMVA